jgi:wobble nucleotide-excising tRNase
VFDDPLSSHDTHRQAKTIELLQSFCGKTNQTIVLSHDAFFLRQLSRRCSSTAQICYEMTHDGTPGFWSKAVEANLDDLCQSDHALQIKKLKAFLDRREGDPAAVAPSVRRVLETHYRQHYRAYFAASDNLGRIVQKIEVAGETHRCWKDLHILATCNLATADEHHGEDPDSAAVAPIDPDNLAAIVRDCLRVTNIIPGN